MRKTQALADSLHADHNPELPNLNARNDNATNGGSRLVDTLQDAIKTGSNELHFEQDSDLCRIRKRVNGQLDETRIESATLVVELIEEVQILSNVNSNPQHLTATNHGNLTLVLEITNVNHRLDCLYYPTTSGHNLTIKISGVHQLPETLEQTPLEPAQIQSIRDQFSKTSHGLTLVCGPDINLLQALYYGLLGETNCIESKIVSLEHHSAKEFPRINQLSLAGADNVVQISKLAIQHADRLFIDWQCARNKLLIKAVLDSYQSAIVFIKAQDATTAISQLTDYAVNERQLATNLSTLIHLDSIRTVCPHCANSHELSGTDMQWLEGQALGKKECSVFVYAPGCERCDYSGSMISASLMSVCDADDSLKSAIESRSSAAIDKAILRKQGESAVSRQIASLVSSGKVSFTEYKIR